MSKADSSFGPKERRDANDAQLLTFFGAYDTTWRLSKLLMIRSLLKDRERVRAELQASGLGGLDDAKVYGPLTNGLLFSAVAELMMLVEDLLALIKFIRSREHFARSLTHYSAGQVTNLVGPLKSASDARLLSAFMVPPADLVEANRGEKPVEEVRAPYLAGTRALLRMIREVPRLYERFDFYYGQYKHGLTIALRPFGGPLRAEVIAERKRSTSGTPVYFETRRLSRSKPQGTVAFTLTPQAQPFLPDLWGSDSLLRYSEAREVSIETLVSAGWELTNLVNVIVQNRVDLAFPQRKPATNMFRLPLDDPERPLGAYDVEVDRANGRWTLEELFREEL